jgi:hypothetical protein
MLQQIAFLPIEILIGTFIIESTLEKRDKAQKIGKLHVVVDIFFSEFGMELISKIAPLIQNYKGLKPILIIDEDWKPRDFKSCIKQIEGFPYKVIFNMPDIMDLKSFLNSKKYFLTSFFANQNLMEHDTFTDALMAVYHVHDEFQHRPNLNQLNSEDLCHINEDIEKAYQLILIQWIYYMENVKKNYPYLFRLSVKTNPFSLN